MPGQWSHNHQSAHKSPWTRSLNCQKFSKWRTAASTLVPLRLSRAHHLEGFVFCQIHLFHLYLLSPLHIHLETTVREEHWQWYALSGMQWTIQCTFALYLTFRSSLTEWILLLLCRYKTVKCRIFSHIFTLHWWSSMYIVLADSKDVKRDTDYYQIQLFLPGTALKWKTMFYFIFFQIFSMLCKDVIKEHL